MRRLIHGRRKATYSLGRLHQRAEQQMHVNNKGRIFFFHFRHLGLISKGELES